MPVTLVKSKWSSGNLIFYEDPAKAGAQIHFGEDGSGLDVKLFGATSGCYMEWDEANDVANIVRTSAAITGAIEALTINHTLTGTGTGHYVHTIQVNTITNVKVGNIAGIRSYVDFSTNGYVNGAASAFVAEFDMAGSAMVRGTYRAISVEFSCPDNFVAQAITMVAFHVNASGNTATEFDRRGYLFELSGLTTGLTSMWCDRTEGAASAANEWVRVITKNGDKWLALYDAIGAE